MKADWQADKSLGKGKAATPPMKGDAQQAWQSWPEQAPDQSNKSSGKGAEVKADTTSWDDSWEQVPEKSWNQGIWDGWDGSWNGGTWVSNTAESTSDGKVAQAEAKNAESAAERPAAAENA